MRNVMSISGGILQFSLAVSWQAGSFHRDFSSLCDNGEIHHALPTILGLKSQCLFNLVDLRKRGTNVHTSYMLQVLVTYY